MSKLSEVLSKLENNNGVIHGGKVKSKIDTVMGNMKTFYTGVDNAYIDSFNKDYAKYINDYNNEIKNVSYGNVSGIKEKYSNLAQDLKSRANRINAFISNAGNGIDGKIRQQIQSSVDAASNSINSTIANIDKSANYYSQWATQEDYDKDMRGVGYYNKYKSYGYDDLMSILGDLSSGEEKDWLASNMSALLGQNKDFAEGVSKGKETHNPSVQYYIDYQVQEDDLANRTARGEEGASEKLTELIENKQKINDPLKFYLDNAVDSDEARQFIGGMATGGVSSDFYQYIEDGDENCWNQITEDERQVYLYTLGTKGTDAAMEYLDSLTPVLQKRQDGESARKIDEFLGQYEGFKGFLANAGITAVLIPLKLFSSLSYVNTVADIITGGDANRYSGANNFRRGLNALQSGIGREIADNSSWEIGGKNVLEQAYNLGVEGVEMWAMGSWMGPFYLALKGMGAAQDTAEDIYARGGNAAQVLLGSLAAGSVEAILEKLPLDNLFGKGAKESVDTIVDWFKMIGRQAGTEALEEVGTEIANNLTDDLLMGDKSNIQLRVKEILENDPQLSLSDARKQAFTEKIYDLLWAASGGAILGGTGSAVFGGKYLATNNAINTQLGAELKGVGADVEGMLDYAANFKADNKLINSILKKSTADNISELNLGRLYSEINTEVESKFKNAKTFDDVKAVYNEIVNQNGGDSILNIANYQAEKYAKSTSPLYETDLSFIKPTEKAEPNSKGGNNVVGSFDEEKGVETTTVESKVAEPATEQGGEIESTLPNISAQGPEADPVADAVFEARGVERLTEDQKFIKRVGKAFGREVLFKNLDEWRTDENGKRYLFSPNGKYDKNTGKIYINSSKNAEGNALAFIFKHELTHFAETAGSAFTDFMNGIMDSQAFKNWVRSKGYSDSDTVSATMAMNAKYIERWKFTGKDAEHKANIEMVADFVGENLFGGKNGLAKLEQAIKQMQPKTVKNFKERILNILDKLKSALQSIGKHTEIEALERDFVRICDEAMKNAEKKQAEGEKGQKENSTEGGVEYSVVQNVVDSNGNIYDNAVLLDTNFFDGISPRNWGKKLKQFVENRSINNPFTLPIIDENGNVQQVQFAKRNDRVKKDNKSNHKVLDKLSNTSENISKLSVLHIDEIIEISEENNPYYTNEHSHQWLDENGWLHRNANVINPKNGNIYNITIDIAKAKDGRIILYATDGKIKKVGNVQVNSLNKRGSGQNSNFKYSIPNSSENVNTKLEERLSGDDLLNAQDLIEEIQSVGGTVDDNGYVTVYHRTTENAKEKILSEGKMTAKEDGIFFSTKPDGQAEGYGNAIVEMKIPVENLVLDDIFDDEAHLRYPLKNRNATLDVSEYISMPENEQYSVGLTDTEQFDTKTFANQLIYKYGESSLSQKKIADLLTDIEYDFLNSWFSDAFRKATAIAESFNLEQFDDTDTETLADRIMATISEVNKKTYDAIRNQADIDKKSTTEEENKRLKSSLDSAKERIRALEVQRNEHETTSKKRKDKENPISIAKMNPKDANTTPFVEKQVGNASGDKRSNFYENMQGSSIFDERFKEDMKNDDYIKTYNSTTNKETLKKAVKALETGGQQYVTEWFQKPTDEASLLDITVGLLLIDRYQRVGNTEGAIATAQRVREMGTASGQQVQIFSIIGRFDPNTMAAYAQKELSTAYELLVKGKTNKWVEANKKKFELTPDEIESIRRRTLQAAMLPECRQKAVLLAEIVSLLQNKIPPESGQSIRAWQRISMLLNVKTNVRNIVGNLSMVPVYIASDYFGTVLDKAVAKKTNVRTTGISDPLANALTKSGREQLKKTAKGFGKGIYESFDDFKRGIHTKQEELNRYAVEGFDAYRATGDIKQSIKKREGVAQGGKSFNENTEYKAINAIARKLNALDSLTSFCLEVGDRPFFEMWFMNSLNNQLRLNKTTEPTPNMIDIATQDAMQRTWQDESKMAKMVANLKKNANAFHLPGTTYGLGDFIFKFTKTPANIAKAIVDFSPIGLVSAAYKAYDMKNAIETAQFTPQMQRDFIKTASNAITGTVIYALVIIGASLGFVEFSGAGDDDKDAANFEKYIVGIPPYSIELFGTNVTYDWLQPFGSTLAISAAYMENRNDPETSWDKDILDAFVSAGTVFTEQSFLKSLNEFFKAVEADGNIFMGLLDMAISDPSVNIPTLFSQVGSFLDEDRRSTYDATSDFKTMLNGLMSKIPGVRKLLPEQVDVLGEDVENNQYLDPWRAFGSPYNEYPESAGEVANEIYDLYKTTGDKTVIPRVAPNSITVKGRKYSFDTAEKAEYQRSIGKSSAEMLEILFKQKSDYGLNEKQLVDVINKIYNYAAKLAKVDVVSKDYDYELISAMVGTDKNGNPILTKGKYNTLTKEAKLHIIQETLLTKAEMKFKTPEDAVKYYIKQAKD